MIVMLPGLVVIDILVVECVISVLLLLFVVVTMLLLPCV